MMQTEDKQISLTDPDARSMATSGRGSGGLTYARTGVTYAIQITVELQTKLRKSLGIPRTRCPDQPRNVKTFTRLQLAECFIVRAPFPFPNLPAQSPRLPPNSQRKARVDLPALKRPPTTFIHDLARRLICQKCKGAGSRNILRRATRCFTCRIEQSDTKENSVVAERETAKLCSTSVYSCSLMSDKPLGLM
jgi:hypothetical protein